jgi:predicted adenylyl cyclase CyaB
MHEVKIKVKSIEKIKKQLKKIGAEFVEEQKEIDTYFNQVKGNVLKIREGGKGDMLFKINTEGKTFTEETEDISDTEETKKKLTKLYGIRCIIKKKRYFYIYKNLDVSIDCVKDIGCFLVIEGDNPEKLLEILGYSKNDIIPKSFCEIFLEK